MKFHAKEDISLPRQIVFDHVSDFDRLEKRAMRRDVEVERTSGEGPLDVGTKWRLKFQFRGRSRKAVSEIIRYDAPEIIEIETETSGIDLKTRVDLIALSPTRTRLALSFDMTARTLSARLLVQSLKLAKGSIETKLSERLEEYARELESRVSA